MEPSVVLIRFPLPPGSTLVSFDVEGLSQVPLQRKRELIEVILNEVMIPLSFISDFSSLLQGCLFPQHQSIYR